MSNNYCDNRLVFLKGQKALIKHSLDVQFLFEKNGEIVTIPANKLLLTTSSPVFHAMFNGELKEKGEVKITDASPEAFREFLQFFHEFHVKLTMENIAEVLKLIDKYDVPDCLPVCSDFVKENTKVNDVLWTLHLAVELNLDDLEQFCREMIEQNAKTVFDMISFENGKLRVVSGQNRLLDTDELEKISPYLVACSKNIISNVYKEEDVQLGAKRKRFISPFDDDLEFSKIF